MIPILFESGTTDFTTNGIGRLSDCIKATVTEERNGIYELSFEYPITGWLYKEIQLGRIVLSTHDDRGDMQPFIIYGKSIPDVRGVVQFNAHHISYMLNDMVVMPFTASSCATALNGIKSNSVPGNPFEFWTDKATTANFKNTEPRLARNMLGGEENSILDVYGSGEYEFDKFTVKLHANRGVDSGVEIRYAKNLIDLKQDIDMSTCYNAVVPYWADSEGQLVTLPEQILVFAEEGEYIDASPMDLSDQFENKPTVAQLRQAATTRYRNGDSWLPNENIQVDFVQMWQTEEYKNFAALQRVSLCDTVSVFYEPADVMKVKQKVIRVVYNVLLDRYDSIELGTLQTSLGQSIRQELLQEVPTTSFMEEAIKYASDMIRGGLGGYVVMTPGENGYPQEILIMDTPDINTAVNVWRFNRGGLGHSHNGYNGPYSDIALTADGRINATMITTGVLNANIIKAGTLSDYNGNTSFNLSTGAFTMKKGSINLGDGKFIATDAGKLTAIGGGLIRDPNSNTIFNLDSGLLTINKGSINLGGGKFIATDAGKLTAIGGGTIRDPNSNTVFNLDSGLLTINKGSINLGSGNFSVTDAGLLTIKKGSINLGNGNFTVNDSGSLTAKTGSIGNLNIDNGVLRGQSGSKYVDISNTKIVIGGASTFTKIEDGSIDFYKGNYYGTPDSYQGLIDCNHSSGNGYLILTGGNADYDVGQLVLRVSRFDVNSAMRVDANFTVTGTKSRKVKTQTYSDRLHYCYETPTPLFGDIGEAVLDEDGICYVDIDDIFTETIAEKTEYQVFLQKEGEGDCYIAEKTPRYFIIKGTPNLKVTWELKAKQRDYETYRLEQADVELDEYEYPKADTYSIMDNYITEQEELLYGYN